MADLDVTSLENIFRMITPADVLGAQKMSLGKDDGSNVTREIMKILLDNGASGALSIDDLIARLETVALKASGDSQQELAKIISIYSSSDTKMSGNSSAYVATDKKGEPVVTSFKEIIGPKFDDYMSKKKKLGVILSRSAYIAPAARNAERVEMFMSSIPSIVMSRCVPFLDVEFSFDRPQTLDAGLRTMSQMKFLLGSAPGGLSGPDETMAKLQRMVTGIGDQQHEISSAGMEMFTSPQTLVNPTPLPYGSRYADVIDPFRPFASIESFTINVTPTVGMYSYKKGNLIFKLHDRSRLAEISDLIQPQIYTSTTVWVTYGWRHPDEPGNPYAEFINNNMLVREAYGIVNSGFSFDQVGQASITLELFTKGVTEMRSIALPDTRLATSKRIEELMGQIEQYKRDLNITPAEGLSKEIRATQIIDSAERGEYPDFSTEEVKNAITALDNSFRAPGGKFNHDAADGLVKALREMYKPDAKGKTFDTKERVKNEATNVVKSMFTEVQSGLDPFLPSSDKWNQFKGESGVTADHPYIKLIEAYNTSKSDVTTLGPKAVFNRKLVSFGKLFTTFAGQLIMSIPNIDELQVFFYAFNDHAGQAACTNIAEFPINMPVFLYQYRDHVQNKGSERITLEEFLQLVVQSQIDDHRSVAYGFSQYFEPFDPANPHDEKQKKETKTDPNHPTPSFESDYAGFTSGRGPFQKPVISMYVETVYKANDGSKNVDLLRTFELRATESGSENLRSNDYSRIMRIHISDKQANPYNVAAKLLRSDVGGSPAYYEINDNFVQSFTANQQHALQNIGIDSTTKLSDAVAIENGIMKLVMGADSKNPKSFNNDEFKRLVSKMVPSIIYGSNATNVREASLASKQDPLLSTVQMMGAKAGRPNTTQPNGSGQSGMPLRIIPASMTMSTMGCPLLTYGQLFFIDFNTGTTIDNLYGLTGLTHTISPGKFDSSMTLTYYDAYGKYEGAPTIVNYLKTLEVPQPVSKQKSGKK
jgi:hypothetical protein